MFNSNAGNGGYSLADIAAATGNNNNAFGGGNSWWIILLFIFMLFGWGGNRNGNNGGNDVTVVPYPAMGMGAGYGSTNLGLSVAADVQRGFDQSAVINGINAVQTSVNNGFSNAEVSRCNAQANLLQTLNNNQMGVYQMLNNGQVGMLQGFNGLQSQLAQCCCDNRAATQDLKYTVASENCADRQALNNGIRDINLNTDIKFQAIMDKLCQLEMDGIRQNYENRILTMQTQADQLRADNVALRGDISQAAQTAQIEAGQNRILAALNGCGPCNCGNNWNGCCGN